MELLKKYFSDLSAEQLEKFKQMEILYREWNDRINVISRKDISQFTIHHLLHSLAIAKVLRFKPGTRIMDAGTGGGFPGIPLAVIFPEVEFLLVDSIGKKIKVIEAITQALNLQNVKTNNARFESIRESFDFVTGRAVSKLPLFVSMVRRCLASAGRNDLPNGVLYLTGGEIERDIDLIRANSKTWLIRDFYEEEYFITKKLVHLSNFS